MPSKMKLPVDRIVKVYWDHYDKELGCCTLTLREIAQRFGVSNGSNIGKLLRQQGIDVKQKPSPVPLGRERKSQREKREAEKAAKAVGEKS